MNNLNTNSWDSLSLKEKSDIIRVAVQNGISTLPEIKEAYNKFAEGGNLYFPGGKTDESSGVTTGYKNGDKVDTKECARFQNQWLRDNGYLISGNAWNLNDVDTVFSGYEGLEKPTEYSREAAMKYNRAATGNVWNNFDSKTLDPSQPYVVNMFYKGSPKQETAYSEGNNVMGTHTGLLTNEGGKWFVTHNIHGTVHREPFFGLQNSKNNWGVTSIFSPRKNNLKNKVKHYFGFADGGNLYFPGGWVILPHSKEEYKGLADWLGDKYKKVKDWASTPYTTTALDENGHPIIQADKTLATTTSTPLQDISSAAALGIPISAATYGTIPTAVGILAGIPSGIVGGKVGKEMASFMGGNENAIELGEDLGSMTSFPGAHLNVARIGNNIINRNKFFYKNLFPASYICPVERGLKVAKSIITEDANRIDPNITPSWYDNGLPLGYYLLSGKRAPVTEETTRAADKLATKFRDEGYRKYLGLPQKTPLYVDNGDGTWSYNMPYVKEEYKKAGLDLKPSIESVDWITGNGGNVKSTKSDKGLPSFFKGTTLKHPLFETLEDVFDLHPFSRIGDKIVDRYPQVTKAAKKLHFENQLDKLSKKLSSYEVGPILGGKPFTMKTTVPITQTATFTEPIDNLKTSSILFDTYYGWDNDFVHPKMLSPNQYISPLYIDPLYFKNLNILKKVKTRRPRK